MFIDFFNHFTRNFHAPAVAPRAVAAPREEEEELPPFVISAKQFAHRMAPAYLEETKIAGINSINSVRHWIAILDLWIEGKALFLPQKIDKQDLIYLKEILQEYGATLERYINTGVSECQKAAQTTLEEIKGGIKQRKAYYTPLGYAAGVNNQGHAIPLKLRAQGKQVEALALNLGEGAQMHPLVDQSASVERYHFQSFPALIDTKTLFSERGEEAFARLIRLQVEQCPAEVRGYSAEDVYGVLYALGRAQSTFHSKIEDRNSKPQLGDICGDMAVVLLVRDVLIDLGCSKAQIQRLFCLEKLCNIFFFHRHLMDTGGDLDLWTLLKNGQQEFSIRGLKVDKAVLSESEVELIHARLKPIALETGAQIKRLKTITLAALKSEPTAETPSCSFICEDNPIKVGKIHTSLSGLRRGGIDLPLATPQTLPLTPENAAATLQQWVQTAKELIGNKEKLKARAFIYKAITSLAIPDPEHPDFWNRVPDEAIEAITLSLAELARWGAIAGSGPDDLVYPQICIWLTGYAIVDKLIRRKYGQYLTGFASPFYAARGKKDVFEFQMLPLGPLHETWTRIRYYFETMQAKCKRTLFAVGEKSIDITQGVSDLRKSSYLLEPWTPANMHLKFLAPFLEKLEEKSGSLEDQFITLWMNKDNRYIPEGIETLYFFAHYAWYCFSHKIKIIEHLRVQRTHQLPENNQITEGIHIPEPGIAVKDPSKDGAIYWKAEPLEISKQASLGKEWYFPPTSQLIDKEQKKLTENATQCLESPARHEAFWNTHNYRQWARIFSNPDLQISSIIQWMRDNLSLLSEGSFQEVIEIGLFQPGLLIRKIREEGATLDHLRGVIHQAIEHFKSHGDSQTLNFLVRLGLRIETFASEPSPEILADYETVLLDGIKRAPYPHFLYRTLIFLYQLGLPGGRDSLRELIKAQFALSYAESHELITPAWLSVEIASPLHPYDAMVVEAFEDEKWRSQTLAEVFSMVLPDTRLPQGPCSGTYPVLSQGEYSLHLGQWTVHRSSSTLIYLPSVYRDKLPTMKDNTLVWAEQGVYYSQDGLNKLERSPDGLVCSRRFPQLKGCGDSWFIQSTFFFSAPLHGSLLTNVFLFDCWASGNQMIICKREEYKPRYVVLNENSDYRVYKVRPDGTWHLQLMNIWKEENTVSRWFKRLGALKEACVWVNPSTGAIEEFDLIQLDLSFKAEEGRFRCLNHPEYFLAEEQSLAELDHFEGAIVLEDETKPFEDSSRRCLLLAARALCPLYYNFTILAKYYKEGFKVHLYQVDPIGGVLLQPNPEATLYLTLLFAMQRNYAKALHYLDQTRPFRRIPFTDGGGIIQQICKLKDQSPEALAFYLRLALHLIRNSQQVLLDSYGNARSKHKTVGLELDFYKWTAERFAQYLRVHSTKEISRIPGYIRLSRDEELFLLNSIKPHLMQEGGQDRPYWRPIFDIRQTLLKKGVWEGRIGPIQYPLLRPDLVVMLQQDVSFPSDFTPPLPSNTPYQAPVRFSREDDSRHFITLYERARAGKAEFDLFFVMRSGQKGSYNRSRFLHILQYVQKYPDAFQGLNFGTDQEANKKVFAEIVKIAKEASAEMWNTASQVSTTGWSPTVFFHYNQSISLTLGSSPKLAPLPWQFEPKEAEALRGMPKEVYATFLQHFLVPEKEALFQPNTPFAFAKLKSARETTTTQEIVTRLQTGHARLLKPEHGKTVYALKGGKTSQDCLRVATALLEEKKQEMAAIKEEAETLANSYPETAYRLGLRKMGADLPEITLEGILTRSYLTQNPALIRKANPSLSPAQIRRLLVLTIQYHLLQIHVHQLQRGVEALQKGGSIQHFAECIAVHGEFDPTTEPEVVLFQSRTWKSLRPQQADLIQWEIETALEPMRLFAAPAGDGKTTLYIPIAMKRLQRLGFVPISASSKSLYGVDREGLKATSQHVFSFEVDVLELALSTEATAADFKWFYEQLQAGSKNGFKITPEVYFALDLKYQLALETESVEEVRWLRRIFAYLEEHGAILVDECRQTCSPFTQAKIGIGKPLSLPAIDRKVILQIYRLLLSPTVGIKDGRTLQETVRLQENQQATMNDEERRQVKEVVLKQLTEKTSWLQTEGKEDRERAIDLIHIYFDEFFNTAMNLVWRMDHVHSIKSNEELHVPARKRQATRSYFDEVYLTFIATIHGVLQEGLSSAQAIKLFEELEKVHDQEVGASARISEIETSLRTWAREPDLRLSHFSVARLDTMKQFHRLVCRNPEVIFWYLENVLLKQVQYSPEQLTVTPIHFLHGFKQVTLFSADPGPHEIYGIYKDGKGVRKDPQFMAHAVHEFLTPENSRCMTFPFLPTAKSFFKALLDKDPDIFSHLRMICDAGGMLRNFTVTELVADFFDMLKEHSEIALDGLIMFEEASDKEEETNLFVWLKGKKQPIELKGHDIPAALRSLGHNWEKLKLLTIIDPSHRAGANIEQPKGSSVLVFAGEGLTLSDDVQGKLRGRGVLKREQRIIWGICAKLAPMIATPFAPLPALEWEMRNESNTIDKEILLSAFQQIDYWIEAPVRQALHAEDDPHKQIAIWKRHPGFVKRAETDPIQRFKGKRTREAAETVLLDYAQKRYEEFQFKTPWHKATALHNTLKPIIAAVAKRQTHLTRASSIDSRQHSTVHTFQREEMKKEFVSDAHTDLTPETPLPLPDEITLSAQNVVILLKSKLAQPAREVFGSSHLTQGLYFTKNALSTAKTGGESLGKTYLKPVQYILVVEHNKRWLAFALSDDEAAFFQEELLTHETDFHIALLAADGLVAQNGRGRSKFSEELLKARFIQDVVIDVGLASCTLRHPLRFMERIERWDDFWPMWQNMKSWQPLPQLVHAHGVEKLVPEGIKKTVNKTK
ncbi:hypothetical protein ACFLR2_00750 [Chlamydiota bacterium]